MNVSISVDNETFEKISLLADRLGVNRSQLIRMILHEALGVKHYNDFLSVLPSSNNTTRLIEKCVVDPECKAIDLKQQKVYVTNGLLWKDLENVKVEEGNVVIPINSRVIYVIT
jgi:hypothetical protein